MCASISMIAASPIAIDHCLQWVLSRRSLAAIAASGNPDMDGSPPTPQVFRLPSATATSCATPSTRRPPSWSSRSREKAVFVGAAGVCANCGGCDEFGLLLIFDEIQCGWRTGALLRGRPAGCHDAGEGLGRRLPIGAANHRGGGASLRPGVHGTTFGGNPLAMSLRQCRAGRLLKPGFQQVKATGDYLWHTEGLVQRHPQVFEARSGPCSIEVPGFGDVIAAAQERGLLTVGGGKCRAPLPPLIIGREEVDMAGP